MAPGIGVGLGIPFQKNAFSFSSYWATLISATVENAAPTHVVLTFPAAQTSLLAADITCTVNGVARTVSSASWTGAVWTVVLASAVEYGDVVVMTFKLTNTVTVTNNVLTYTALLESTGNGSGVSTLRMRVSADITVTLGDNAKFYSDAVGTLDESATWALTAGALRTIYLKCITGTATMTFSDGSKITYFGNIDYEGWISGANASKINIDLGRFDLLHINISGSSVITCAIPSTLKKLKLSGDGIYCNLTGNPSNSLDYLYLLGDNIEWASSAALSNSLVLLRLDGAKINWTGLDIGTGSNIFLFNLTDYRITKMSSADMITLLTQMTNRTGAMPSTITINDYADYASPPAEVVAAVNALKLAKSITTVNLGA